MPLTCLGYGCVDLPSKMSRLLWAIFLEVGGDEGLFFEYTNSVRSLTTDMGTESGLANFPDCRSAFLARVRGNESIPAVVEGSFCFPSCLQTPGWHHAWDSILKDCCKKWPFSFSAQVVARYHCLPFALALIVDFSRHIWRSVAGRTMLRMSEPSRRTSCPPNVGGRCQEMCRCFHHVRQMYAYAA